MLKRTLRAWHELTGSDHIYCRADISALLEKQGLFLPSSSIVMVDGDNPLDYYFAFFSPGFGIYGNRNFTGRPLRAFDDTEYAVAVADVWREAVREKQILYHQVSAWIDGGRIDYDRLILPIQEEPGRVTAFVTVSVSESYPYMKGRSAQIIPFPSRRP